MSQAYQIHVLDPSHSHTSPTLLNNLTLNTLPIPVPGPGEVLVRIRAAALNYRDILVVADSPLYTARTSAGLTPCADGAGTIEAVGPNSTWSDSIGEGVLLVNNTDWIDGDVEGYKVHHTLGCGGVQGTLRQYAVVSDEFVVRKPKNLGFEEAAAMVSAGGTAMNALLAGGVGPGKTVLTQGTGGVSCFAILVSTVAVALYAAAMGARVIATSSSDEKLESAKKLGASEVINYKTTPEWSIEALALTDQRGVDVLIDVAGAQTVEQSLQATRQGGTVVMIGFLTESKPSDLVQLLLFGAKTLKGILGNSKVMLEQAVALTEEHDLHPEINVFAWADAKKAFEALRAQNCVGKIVILV
ncbi:Zinc-type alcohol dehydrogenase-like protein [Lachnellula hyalina]|uniref:Zinc-type alcohol dehydrogenase-like protein n=1 Tax=Lachnellula hyalina TaxID=1316788 RepID=A0A8H8R5B8_9HELO|nr:Zinc-type alcohol dehydrogenase-like protein [Lachnellula hyalina]TVY28892.1 Zinc-type alcohol dehydrogenase-like protein [Lachnellula hyalina]